MPKHPRTDQQDKHPSSPVDEALPGTHVLSSASTTSTSFVMSVADSEAVRLRLQRSLSAARIAKTVRLVGEWSTFLQDHGYTSDSCLRNLSIEEKRGVIVLFMISLETRCPPVNPTAHMAAVRQHFLTNLQSADVFNDWCYTSARKTTLSGKELSYRKEASLRLPTPHAFMVWMREAYFVEGLRRDDVAMMMVYVGSVVAYNHGLRASEYAHCASEGATDHSIKEEDVYFESSALGAVTRIMPHDLNPYVTLPCCSTEEARLCALRGKVRYLAVKRGHQRGVFADPHTFAEATRGYEGAISAVFTNRGKAAEFCRDPVADKRSLVSFSSIQRVHMLLRSSKAQKDGHVRRLVLQRGEDVLINGVLQPNQERQLMHDLYTLCSMANFDPTDGQRPLFSRRRQLRVLLLNRFMVSEALKAAATHFGLDEGLFSSHCHRIAAASVLSQHGYGEEDIRKFIGWAGRSSLLYERDFANRPSTLRMAQSGTVMSLQDVEALVPPRRHAAHLATLQFSASTREISSVPSAGSEGSPLVAAPTAVTPTLRHTNLKPRAPLRTPIHRPFSSSGRPLVPNGKFK